MKLLKYLYLLLFALLPLSLNNLQLGFGIMLPTEPLELLIALLLVFNYKEVIAAIKDNGRNTLFTFIALYIAWSWISCGFSEMPTVSIKYTVIETLHAVVFCLGFIVLQRQFPKLFLQSIIAYTVVFIPVLFYGWYRHLQFNFAITYSITAMKPFYEDHPLYGATIALLLPFWFYLFIKGTDETGIKQMKPISAIVIALLLFGLFTSFSRAAWLSFVLAGMLCMPYYFSRFNIRRANLFLASLAIFFVAIYATLFSFTQREDMIKNTTLKNQFLSSFNWTYDVANKERLNRYKCAFRMFKERPITGFGNNCYKFIYPAYQKPEDMTRISQQVALDNARVGTGGNSHCDYLAALTELGLPGFLMWLGIIASSLAYCVYIFRHNPNNLLPLFMLFGLLTFSIHTLVNNFIHNDKVSGIVWMCWGLVIALSTSIKKETTA
jgi:putative inorganic carbon (HCO3(-)) transporter